MFRNGIKHLLELHFENVEFGEVSIDDWDKSMKADYIILDVNLRDTCSISILKHYTNLGIPVIVFTSLYEKSASLKILKHNVAGYLLKQMESGELFKALELIFDGERYYHRNVSTFIYTEYFQSKQNSEERINQEYKYNRPINLLTKRQWQVLELLAQGYNNMEISEQLHISDKTAKNHVYTIIKRFNMRDRLGVVLYAIGKKWVKDPNVKELQKQVTNI